MTRRSNSGDRVSYQCCRVTPWGEKKKAELKGEGTEEERDEKDEMNDEEEGEGGETIVGGDEEEAEADGTRGSGKKTEIAQDTQKRKRLYSTMTWQARKFQGETPEKWNTMKGRRSEKQQLIKLFDENGKSLEHALRKFTQHEQCVRTKTHAGIDSFTEYMLTKRFGKVEGKRMARELRSKGQYEAPPGADPKNEAQHLFNIYVGTQSKSRPWI